MLSFQAVNCHYEKVNLLLLKNTYLFVVVYIVEAPMRANTKRTTRGAGDKRGERRKDKAVGNRALRRSVEGRGMGWGTRGIQDGHYMDFPEGKQGI